MRIGGDAVSVNQIPTLSVSHSAFGDHLAITDVSGPHSAAFDVLHSFCDRFDLLFNVIQAFLLANGVGGYCCDHLDFRQRRASAEVAVYQLTLNQLGQIVLKWFRHHQVALFCKKDYLTLGLT